MEEEKKKFVETLEVNNPTAVKAGGKLEKNIVCWKVDTEGVGPNTLLKPGKGIMLLVNVDGVKKTKSGLPITLFGLVKPGKNKKLFFGHTPYEQCDIYAIDQSAEFESEWGLAGNDVITCHDPRFDIQCELTASGAFSYKIENYYDFVDAFPPQDGVLTRDTIRETLRQRTAGLFRGILAAELTNGIDAAYAKQPQIEKLLRDKLESCLADFGLKVVSVYDLKFDYTEEFKRMHKELNNAMVGVKIKKVRNEGEHDDIRVEEHYTKGVAVPIINAQKGSNDSHRDRDDEKNDRVFCSHCGAELRRGDNFCKKCGRRIDD